MHGVFADVLDPVSAEMVRAEEFKPPYPDSILPGMASVGGCGGLRLHMPPRENSPKRAPSDSVTILAQDIVSRPFNLVLHTLPIGIDHSVGTLCVELVIGGKGIKLAQGARAGQSHYPS